MPIIIKPLCPICGGEKCYYEEAQSAQCDICGDAFEADAVCEQGHHVCHMCRQKSARSAIISHCLASGHAQPFPLLLELMQLPQVAMHGPEHHLLLTAALLTASGNEKGRMADLPGWLEEANGRSLEVPGGACGFWGICGAAIGSGIYMSILTQSNPWAGEAWRDSGQLTARCAHAISREGGPRCCKRDAFLALGEAVAHSNAALGTHFTLPERIQCDFYPSNDDCKGTACPFFPAKA